MYTPVVVPLGPGSRVGGYEIVERLSAGGMGEVFRARDVRLKRDAALKFLRDENLASSGHLARFEREAQVLAALNHPNVAQVFGVESHDGAPVIAMEFVDGVTLADRLKSGALPPADALAIAVQLCDGLEAAHERGIVHRDLKPDNVSLRGDGVVKILDFGIARAAGGASEHDATTMAERTAEGIVIGTAPYMSPEQARGLPVDRRTDIWAFGCVLYEMLCGRRAFAGATATDTLAAVIERAPDWSRLPASLPPRLAELLARCLEKNPKDRLRDIADARFEIERARRAGDTGALPISSAAKPSRLGWLLPFAAGLAIAAGGFAVWSMRPAPEEPRPIRRSSISLPAGATLALSRGSAIALSPDGEQIVYAAQSADGVHLYNRRLDDFSASRINGTADAANPFYSADGRWIGFIVKQKLMKVPADGSGSPLAVADVRNARGLAWSSDDGIFVTPANNQPIFRVPAGGGALSPTTSLGTGELSHRWPAVLPDGSLIFSIWNDTGWEAARIVAERAGGGRVDLVGAGGGYPRFLPDGDGRRGFLVYARAEGLLAAPLDVSRLALTASPVPAEDGVSTNLSGGAHFDLSRSGTLAYVPGANNEVQRELHWVGFDGKAEKALEAEMGRFFAVSPDGGRVVRSTSHRNRDVIVDDLARKTSTRLIHQEGNFGAVWSPDGEWVISPRGVPIGNLYRRAADGSNRAERLTESPHGQEPRSITADGKLLAFIQFDPATGADIWVLPMPSTLPGADLTARPPSTAPRPFLQTRFAEDYPSFSPDGRWIAYQSNESGRFEIYVRAFEGDVRMQVSTEGGIMPWWSPDGSALYFRSLDRRMMTAAHKGEGRVDPPRMLFDASGYEDYFAAPSQGRRFLMMTRLPGAEASEIRLVSNFIEELRRKFR